MLTVFFSYNLQPIPYRLDGFLPITLIDLSIACVSISLVCGLNPANLFRLSLVAHHLAEGAILPLFVVIAIGYIKLIQIAILLSNNLDSSEFFVNFAAEFDV